MVARGFGFGEVVGEVEFFAVQFVGVVEEGVETGGGGGGFFVQFAFV